MFSAAKVLNFVIRLLLGCGLERLLLSPSVPFLCKLLAIPVTHPTSPFFIGLDVASTLFGTVTE
jgi:hypothetical protein